VEIQIVVFWAMMPYCDAYDLFHTKFSYHVRVNFI